MMDKVEHIVSYEVDEDKLNQIKQLANSNVEFRTWDGKEVKETLPQFDLVFVDGPPGGKNREFSTKIASQFGDVVLVHDAGREFERKWQDKYLKPKYDMVSKGGNRFYMWVNKAKKGSAVIKIIPQDGIATPTAITLNKSATWKAPDIRIISTARGGGGQMKSITTMMKLLGMYGHTVEFVPLHGKYEVGKGIGRDFMQQFNSTLCDVVIRDWSSIKEPTGMTLVYTDDYVFEFTKPELAEAFSNMKSDRKMMFINYRLAQIGKVEWTKGWDHYGALNSTIIKNLEEVYPEAKGKTSVRPPCVLTIYAH